MILKIATRVRRTSYVRWPAQAPDAVAAPRLQDGRHDDHVGRLVGADAEGTHHRSHPANTGRWQPLQAQVPRLSTPRAHRHTRPYSQ